MIDENLVNRVLDLAVEIQQIPAPTFAEGRRAEFVFHRFLDEHLNDVERDDLGNVFARLPGSDNSSPLVVSAHLDTVFPHDTDLSIHRTQGKIFGPGLGDNSLGVAGLFGLIWALRQSGELPGDLWLVANVGEEGLGDLRGMKAVVNRFGKAARSYIILEGLAFGHIYHRGLGVQRYRITCQTAGGHSWVNFGQPSAIHEMAGLVTRLCALPLSDNPRSTLNVGKIQGGISVNTIAAQAQLELDLRSEDEQLLVELGSQVEQLVDQASRIGDSPIRFTAQIIGKRPVGGISLDHPLVHLAKECLETQGVHPSVGIGSTDANIPLSLGLPAVTIGLTTGGGAHTSQEFIQPAPLRLGLTQVLALVRGVYGL